MENKQLSIIHLHSFFSFADSVIDPKRLVNRLKECNINRIAITDHGNLHHVFRFEKILRENNITYFPGEEFYFTPDISKKDIDHRKSYHLIIIAKSEKGLKNLYKLSSLSYLEGFYYKPRIDYKSLKKYNEDLVCSSACVQGIIGSLILEDKYEEAKIEAQKFKDIFGDRFYIEIMPHNLQEQVKANIQLIKLSKELNIKLVASNDCHLISREDAEYRRFLMLMSKASWAKTDEDLGKLDSICIMNKNELKREFIINHNSIEENIIEEAINNTNEMLAGEQIKLIDETIKLPSYGSEQEIEKKMLTSIMDSLKSKNLLNNKVYTNRVVYEFEVIKKAGYINYFLVVQELFDWCRKNNISVGFARGCFLPNNKIHTKNRHVLIKNKDKLLNNYAFTHDGTFNKILNHFEYNVIDEDCIRIFLSNNKTIECTADHKLFKKDVGFIQAKDLKINDILIGHKTKNEITNIKCSDCGKKMKVNTYSLKHRIDNGNCVRKPGEFLCNKCFNRRLTRDPIMKQKVIMKGALANKRLESRLKNSQTIKKLMQTTNLRKKISIGVKKAFYDDPTIIDRCTKHNGYKSGTFYSEKNLKNIFYQSSYELKALNIFENDTKIKFFDRCNFCIEYKIDDKVKLYKPDFILTYNDNHIEIIEVKANWEINEKAILLKKQAAEEYCKKNNYIYKIITENELFLNNDILHHEIKIRKIENFKYTGKVYDIEVENAHNYNISGVTVHNSAGGSLIAYLLGITKIDPIKFDLMFERFYNAGRTGIGAAPDIDSDFEDERRSEVIKHLEDKYGKDNISQICNISEIKIKTGIRDCARVLNIPLNVVNKISSDVEWDSFETLDEAVEMNEKAAEYVKQYDLLFKYVKYFLNFPRHIGKHAAGIVISSENIGNVCPMMITKVKDESFSLSQFDKIDIPNTGLIKFDILGLSTLTFLKHIVNEIKKDLNINIDIDTIDLNDKNIYRVIFSNAITDNVFQFESSGMKGYLQKMKPENFEDITVLNSLYRPAGLISGSLDNYINNKLTNKEIKTGIDELDKILAKTRYVIAFDEQKMQIVLKFGNYTLEEANYFRKHSDEFNEEKYLEEGKKYKEKFITNAINNGLSEELANNIFDGMCGYAFCRAHSVAYSILSYLCAWFKYYYPLQFLKASFYMSKNIDDTKYNTITALKMAKQFNFNIKGPDINKSKSSFNFIDDNIYWGLSNIKGISQDTAEIIVKNQPFESFNDFIKKCKSRKITKRVIQPLVLLGAFNDLPNYKQEIIEWYNKSKYTENIEEMMSKHLSQYETQYIGLVLSNNIDRKDIKLMNCINPDKIKDLPENSNCIIVGYLADMKILKSKSNKLYGKVIIVDDLFNNYELITSDKSIQDIEMSCGIGDLVLCGIKKLDGGRFSLNKSQIVKL